MNSPTSRYVSFAPFRSPISLLFLLNSLSHTFGIIMLNAHKFNIRKSIMLLKQTKTFGSPIGDILPVSTTIAAALIRNYSTDYSLSGSRLLGTWFCSLRFPLAYVADIERIHRVILNDHSTLSLIECCSEISYLLKESISKEGDICPKIDATIVAPMVL